MFKQLENIRQQKEITITDLCEEAGISRRNYHNWKSYSTSPTLKEFEKICKVLKIEFIAKDVF